MARGFLGISAQAVPADDTEALHLPKGTRGAMITDVTPDSPAEKAGLKRGDVILAFNHVSIVSWEDLRLVIAETTPGTKVELTISRDGKPLTISAALAKNDEKPNELLPGVDVSPLTSENRRRLGIPVRFNGLLVTAVEDSSPYREQLIPNVLIVQIDREDTTDLTSAKAALTPGRHMLYVFYRGALRVLRLEVN